MNRLFGEEVELALRPYFEQNQMKRSAMAAGVRVPLFIEGKGLEEQSSVLAFDGVLAPTQLPSYEWEEKMGHYFRKQGIAYAGIVGALVEKPETGGAETGESVVAAERVVRSAKSAVRSGVPAALAAGAGG
ncbi:MAG: hypothetical protein IPL27_28775 [Lewinellaceae bacterium]|nr:hypothetical protein [Lewinellaceae bacterium]